MLMHRAHLRTSCFQTGTQYRFMVGVQDNQLALHPYIHILRCDSLQVVGELELNADPLQAVPQDLSNRIKVSGQLVHIGGCCVPQIVKTDVGHLGVTQQLSKIRGDPLSPLWRAVRLCENKVIVKIRIP